MATTEETSRAAVAELAAYQTSLRGPSWLRELQERARASFESISWPTTSEEEWRRTNLSPFEFEIYRTYAIAAHAAPEPVDSLPGEAPRSAFLHYRDGVLLSSRIERTTAERGVIVADITTIPESSAAGEAAKKALEKMLESADNRLQYWNLALANGAAFVYVPKDVVVEQPVEIFYEADGDEQVLAPLTVIVAETGASVSIVRRFQTSEDEGEVLVVDGNATVIGANARVRLVDLQRLNDESLFFSNGEGYLERDSYVHRTELSIGADFAKTRFDASLEGPGSDAVLNGIYFAEEEQHMDIRTVQRHRAPNALSRAFYRGAVRDESHAIYQGLIDVAAKAPGTDAYLTNKNLILTEEARADSIPSLNIKTDDVRCSHGSTTGKLDEKQIYYLQTRGYPEREAKRTLIEGYFEDLVVQLPEDLRDEIRELVAQRIP
ncbi:MAG: Fe-S cluster assembly protein SufD [Spirochaetales bacterium]